jgi:hypothetical protein
MADPSEELVVEVEIGIADPPFIAIPRGQVLSPMSVGRRGMWRIEGGGVLDVHGYVYFDGKRFFLQSVDERQPIVAHGQPIGRAWTSVSPPCKIEMGSARLHFRATYTEEPDLDDQETAIVDRPKPPMDRPFEPGAFAHRPESESTRVQPLDPPTAPGSAWGGNLPPPPPPPPPGRPVHEIVTPAQLHRPALNDTQRMHPDGLGETSRQPGLAPPPPFAGARPPLVGAMPALMPPTPTPPPTRVPAAAPNPQGDALKQKWDELSGPKKILVALLPALMVSLYFLFIADDELPAAVPVAADAAAPVQSGPPIDAGPVAPVPPTIAVSQLPVTPPPPPPPPPASGSAQPTATNPAQRTLERQAVDWVASGQYERAAAAYDQLAQQFPDRPAYREAARILRGKLDAGP